MPDAPLDRLLRDGRAAFDRGDFRAARAHFSQAALVDPKDGGARFWLAAAQYHLGQVGEACKHLEDLVAARTPPVPERPAAVHEYLARCLLADDARRAIAVAEDGVRRDPRDARLRFVLGNTHLRLSAYEDALRHLDEAWALEGGRGGRPAFPAHPGQVAFARSTALVALRRWDEALAAVEDALAREPGNAAYHNRRGVVLFDGRGDAAAAAGAVRGAIELDPDTAATGYDGVFYYNLAVYLERLGRRDEALAAVERAIAISPARDYKALRDRLGIGAPAPAAPGPAAPSLAAPRERVTFASVGGMHGLKEQVRRIMDVVFTRRDQARRYGIERNGILLYGPPGSGKTFFAEAIAGEFGLTFLPVSLAAAQTKWVGGAGETVERVFREARERAPALLFLDELDAIAARREGLASGHEQHHVAALFQQIDAARRVPGLVLAAATNRLEAIDPAVVREGRFDYKVKIYRPDFDARREIVTVLLRDRPHDASVDPARLAQQMEGFSAAQVRHVVDAAAMAALEADAPISAGHFQRAIGERLAERRYGGPPLGWDDLILPEATKRKLQSIERFIEHPELAEELGVAPPTGVLLHGPPGTGKTTVARVLASQVDAAFLVVGPSDIFAKWVGESEQRVKELFERARDQVPAIIFLDEIESILGRRGDADTGATRAANAVVSTFLAEMDGIAPIKRVFVVGATNRPDLVDEAVLRPGRLSESIEIGLPDAAGRLAMLRHFCGPMRLAPGLDLAAVAARAEGASGADLRGLCTAAGRNALLRILDAGGDGERIVDPEDFARALDELFPRGGEAPAIGFQAPRG